jgi:hypothetical protein
LETHLSLHAHSKSTLLSGTQSYATKRMEARNPTKHLQCSASHTSAAPSSKFVYLNKRKFLPGVSQAKKGDESLKY